MSYQVGPFCYASKGAALSAIASAQTGAVVSQGGVPYVVSASAFSSGIKYDYHDSATGALAFSSSVPLDVPACGLMGVSDGAILGWAVALVWFSAWAVSYLARHINQTALGGVNDS